MNTVLPSGFRIFSFLSKSNESTFFQSSELTIVIDICYWAISFLSERDRVHLQTMLAVTSSDTQSHMMVMYVSNHHPNVIMRYMASNHALSDSSLRVNLNYAFHLICYGIYILKHTQYMLLHVLQQYIDREGR